MAAKRRCKAKTKLGKRCKAWARADGRCIAHADKETRDKAGFGGPQPGSGRPPLPKPHSVMRERIEADVDAMLKPYFDARDHAVVFVKYEGELIVTDTPDLEARQRAAERLLDRVYGKPAQAVELTGLEGGPIAAEITTAGAKEVADAAHDFLARIAGPDA